MKIGYVCTNFNNSQVTIEAFESLVSTSKHQFFCVAVDNASSPEELEKLTAYCDSRADCDLLANQDNVGYFNGLNKGLEHLRSSQPNVEWVLIGNNDLEFEPELGDKLDALRETYAQHSVISPDIVTLDGDHQNPHVIERITPLREMLYDLYNSNFHLARLILKAVSLLPRRLTERGDEAAWHTEQEIHQGHGSCYILTPKFFQKFKRLWAPTFLYYEEYFLSLQLEYVDEKVFYHPGIRVRHKCHATFSNLPKRKVWQYSREAHKTYRKFRSGISGNEPRALIECLSHPNP